MMQCDKSRNDALRLKNLGNVHFRKSDWSKALQSYTRAILLVPHGDKEKKHFLQKSLEDLKALSPPKYQVASLLYTAEMLEAETERDPLLSVCFGNRSAALYELKKYDECLADIREALRLGFPPASIQKLHKRQEKCQRAAAVPDATSLLADDHHHHPAVTDCSVFESNAVSVSTSQELGRYLTAARDISAGEVVISEEPHAAILAPSCLISHCSHCFRHSPYSLLPCVLCPCEAYCSSECRQRAWTKYHWMECKFSGWRKKADWMEVLCLRTVLSAGPSEVWSCCEDSPTVQGSYSRVYGLVQHEDKFSSENQEAQLKKMAESITLNFGEHILKYLWPCPEGTDVTTTTTTTSGCSLLKRLFLRHLLQLRCNSHRVTEIMSAATGRRSRLPDSSSTVSVSSERVETVKEVTLGTVLLPTASLMNHSCLPNAIFRFLGSRVQVCVTMALKKGDSVNNSYGPQVGRMKTAERKRELREKYFFDCQCVACSGLDPHLVTVEAAMDGLACLQCSIGALALETATTAAVTTTNTDGQDGETCHYLCSHCKTRVSKKDLSNQIRIKNRTEMLFESATRDVDLELLLECQKMQASVLHRHNKKMAATNDALAQMYASQGDFLLSCSYLELSCSAVGALYGKQSIEFANEMHKLASVYFNCGQMEQALEAAERAKNILLIYYGAQHRDCKLLERTAQDIKKILHLEEV